MLSYALKRSLSAGILAILLAGVSAAQNPVYLNLPVPADTFSVTYGVNASGQVVGSYILNGTQQLFVWRDGVTTLIGSPVSTSILWAAINNLGQVVFTTNRPVLSYLWANNTITQIGTFAVASINDRSVVVGCEEKQLENFSVSQSVIWNGGDVDFIRPEGETPFSCAFSINNSDQVAGTFYDLLGRPVSDGYLWHQGNTTIIGDLGGRFTQALGVNDSAIVVGVATDVNGNVEAIQWQNGVIQGLGFPTGATFSIALKVDAAGRIVGNSSFPWVWQNGVFTKLNAGTCTGACIPSFAVAIADRGTSAMVAGNCVNPANQLKLAACVWNLPATVAARNR
jgi:uncharacterized membrane protein